MIAATLTIIFLLAFITVARNGGGGAIGRKVRGSDHLAHEQAIRDKEEELEHLRSLRSKYPKP